VHLSFHITSELFPLSVSSAVQRNESSLVQHPGNMVEEKGIPKETAPGFAL
jgi:hypothetical protein